MEKLFDVKPVDTAFYKDRLEDFLPTRIIDIHTHVWLNKFKTEKVDTKPRSVTWPSLVAAENPIESLIETYRLMFPGKQVTPLIFGQPKVEFNLDQLNEYIKECAQRNGYPSLILATPKWSGEELEEKIKKGKFAGCKVYLNFSEAYIPKKEIRIFDFLPHHQLEVLNRNSYIVMLHIPRDKRLKDPANLAQLLEIERKYPNVKLIVAHVGRAYCNEDLGNAFEVLAETKNMMFDFSANTNQYVFEQLIKAVGSRRILFGSDLPILRMRMRRICENGIYINLVPPGLYGDVSGDPNMREVDAEDGKKLTFFMYEEIDSFRRASYACGLSKSDIENVFYNNAANLISRLQD